MLTCWGPKRRVLVVVGLLALALLSAGCGSDWPREEDRELYERQGLIPGSTMPSGRAPDPRWLGPALPEQ